MSEALDYPRWIADALRTVARRALALVAEEGLPGEHHFYLTFHTRAEGVHLPGHLRDRAEEITIILENQFWDLVVDDEAFAVTLAFGGSRQRVVVPFAAVTAFADPSVPFALRFEVAGEAVPGERLGEAAGDETGAETGEETGKEAGEEPAGAPQGPTPVAEPAPEGPGGEVVSLDHFRKKKE